MDNIFILIFSIRQLPFAISEFAYRGLEVWMEGYIACEEEKDLIIEELTTEKDRIIEEQKKAINILQRRLEVLEGAYNKLVKEHNEVLRQTVKDLK